MPSQFQAPQFQKHFFQRLSYLSILHEAFLAVKAFRCSAYRLARTHTSGTLAKRRYPPVFLIIIPFYL